MTTRMCGLRSIAVVALVASMVFGTTSTAYAVPPVGQLGKLTATDGAAGDGLGQCVAISGDTMVVGAPKDDGVGADSGSAYVFRRTAGVWSQQTKLTAADGATGDAFGAAVAISGDTIVVGAPMDDGVAADSGSAYAFTRAGGVWSQQAKLVPATPGLRDQFGIAVAVAGDSAAVGALNDDDKGIDSGAAYVFTRSAVLWSQQAKVTAADGAAGDHLGRAIAIFGDTVIAGALSDDGVGADSGSAYVFTRSAALWTQQAKLVAADAAARDYFGGAVAVSGETAAVGAFGDDDLGTNSGSAYVFTRAAGVWTKQAKLTASDGTSLDNFGSSVALAGDTLFVGAPNDAAKGTASGSAYAFTRSLGAWSQRVKLTAWDAAANDRFGASVAVSSEAAAVGAPGDDDKGTDSGSVYAFSSSAPTSITIKTNATTSKIGGVPILSGLVTPSGLVGQNIVVYVKKAGKSYWTYSSNRTVYDRYGVPSWQYKYYFKRGMTKGLYTYKAFVPAWPGYQASTSPTTVSVRVK
jgi:hypothetical protein